MCGDPVALADAVGDAWGRLEVECGADVAYGLFKRILDTAFPLSVGVDQRVWDLRGRVYDVRDDVSGFREPIV